MKRRSGNLRRPQRLLICGLLALFMACSTGSEKFLAPVEVNSVPQTRSIQVELLDGQTLVLWDARVRDGRLIGTIDRSQKGRRLQESRSIALSDIRLVKISKKGGSAFAFIPVALAAVWLIFGAVAAPSPPPSESCPFIYSWDGDQYVFEAEPYGGAICRGLQRSEWCRLDWLRSVDRRYRVRVVNELDETQYTDEVRLLVVDHEPGQRVAADASGGIHAFSSLQAPQSARDETGRDILPLTAARDLRFWQSEDDGAALDRKPDLRHELNFVFSKPAGAGQARLLVNAWTSPWGAEVPKLFLKALGRDLPAFYGEVNALGPAWREIMAWFLREELYLLRIMVRTPDGWQTRGYIQGGGPFMANDKAYTIDISDVEGSILELRLCPPVTFWRINYLAVDFAPDPSLRIHDLAAQRAVDRDGADVTKLVQAADGKYLVASRTGDWSELYFNEPPPEKGLERSFILKVNGYYDIHLPVAADPRNGLADRFLYEPGFTIRFARDAFRERRKP